MVRNSVSKYTCRNSYVNMYLGRSGGCLVAWNRCRSSKDDVGNMPRAKVRLNMRFRSLKMLVCTAMFPKPDVYCNYT